jgi:hypothetical protein
VRLYPLTGGGGRQDGGALDGERLKILEEREKWEKEKNEMQTERNQKDYQRAMASVDNGILDLLPKTKEAKQTCDLLNRVTMTFDVVLEKGNEVRVTIRSCVMITLSFLRKCALSEIRRWV